MNGGRMNCLLREALIWISLMLVTSASEIVPVFLEEPESAVIPHHASLTLPCKVAPSSAVVRWKFNGDFISDGDSRGFSLDQTNLHISKFRHRPKSESTEGIYQCIATTSIGSVASRPARLSRTVLRRFQGRGDLHQNVTEGYNVMLPCQPPESSPEAKISFEVNGTELSTNTDRYRLLSSGSLMIYNATQSDQGQYRCKATNPMTNHTREADHVIHVQVNDSTNGDHSEGARIIFSTSVKATEGQNVTLECVVEGSPLPIITWEKYGGEIPIGRSDIKYGNLHIYNVTIEDTGTYVCKANNKIGSDRKAVTLEMIVAPETTAETELVTANPGESVRLSCVVTGSPVPEVIWYHNAVPITNILRADNGVTTHLIKDIVYGGAGIYQCMSSNEMGVAYSTIRVEIKGQPVNGNNVIDDHAVLSGGILKGANSKGSRNKSNPAGRKKKRKKKKRKNGKRKGRRREKNRRPANDESTSKVKLVPPTHPDITQLSDTSVKLNWTVPDNDGLKITFFRVQYKAIKPKRGQWRTDDTEIRGDKRMYEVAGLKPEGTYKFRIAAVYSNNDNKAGPVSERFTLKMAPYPDPQRPDGNPVIVEVRPLVHNNNYALNIKWTYQPQKKSPIEGFLLFYMKYEGEGDFHQVRLMEPTIRTYLLRNLSQGTSYNIYIKCFNSAGESNPSNRVVKATLGGTDVPFRNPNLQVVATPKYPNSGRNPLHPNMRPTPHTPTGDMKEPEKTSSQSSGELLYMILGIVLGVMMLFLILFMFMCWWKQRQQRRMMDAMNDAVRCKFQDPSQRIYSDSLRKKYSNGGFGVHSSMNGGLPNGHIGNSYTRMNVSVNPLSELDDRPITNGPPHYQSLTYVPNGSVPSHHHHGSDSNFNKIHRSMDQCLHSMGQNNSQCLQSPDSLGSGEAPASPPSPHFHNRVPIGFNSDLNTDSQPEQYSNRSCDQQAGSHEEDLRRSYENSLSVDDGVGNAGKHKRRRKRGAISSDNTTRDQATNTDLSSNEGTIEFSSFKEKVPSSSQISGQTSPKTVSDSEQCSAFTDLQQRV